MEYKKTIETILVKFDIKNEVQKKKAFEACIEYADKKMNNPNKIAIDKKSS